MFAAAKKKHLRAVCAASHQDLQQLLQVAGDERVVLVQRPAALLRVIAVSSQVAEDHLQPLLVVTHLTLGQGGAQILQRTTRDVTPASASSWKHQEHLSSLKILQKILQRSSVGDGLWTFFEIFSCSSFIQFHQLQIFC